MKVSVITIVYNDEAAIKKTLESVVSQVHADFEYIVIDGGSTVGTLNLISHYHDRIDKLISEPDDGIYDAMNKGAAHATGNYVLFMNAGDQFYSDKVLAEFLKAKPDTDIVFGDALLRFPDGRELLYNGNIDNILKKMPFSHQSCFVRTEVQNYLEFNRTFSIAADYDFMLRAYKHNYGFKPLDLTESEIDDLVGDDDGY